MSTAIAPKRAANQEDLSVPKHEQALEQLEALCESLEPGDRIPALPELMRRLRFSERTILRALEELQRNGRIVRRHGSGTFVANPPAPPIVPSAFVDHQTVVAIRIPDNSYYDRCMDLLFRHAAAAGLSLVCRIVDRAANWESLVPQKGDGSLGYVLFRYDLAPLAKKIQEQGNRVVIVGAPPVDVYPEVPCVYGDHEQGGYLAARHLLDLGHRHIAYQATDASFRQTLRWKGFQRAIRDVERESKAVVTTSILTSAEMATWRSEPALAAAYFRRSDAPTNVIAWNDHEAAMLVVSLNAAGVRVPEEVSVVGYDNLPEGQMIFPQLTTVDHAMDWQLRTALELLRRPMTSAPIHSMVAMPTLVARGSTEPLLEFPKPSDKGGVHFEQPVL